MLDKKTLYTIYLLHKASNLLDCYRENPTLNKSYSLETLRLRGYLSGNCQMICKLDNASLALLLKKIKSIMNCLPDITKEQKAEFPSGIRGFNRGYKIWLNNIKTLQ